MAKTIEQCMIDCDKAINNMAKIMLKPETERIKEMEEELLQEAAQRLVEECSKVDLTIHVCPIISFAFNGQKNYLYEIRDYQKDETEVIEGCISRHSDLYTSADPKALSLLFNTFIKQTLDEQGFVISGVYDTTFNGRKVRYRIIHEPLTNIEIEL